MSCQLTEEQRMRIEENRKRALAKRKGTILAYPSEHCMSKQMSSVSETEYSNVMKASSLLTSKSQVIRPSETHIKKKPQQHYSKASTVHQSSGSSQWRSKSVTQGKALIKKEQFYGSSESILKGKCVLRSIDRFAVEIEYHAALIEFFKQFESRSYDTSKRTWSFSLVDYEKLRKGAGVFQPSVHIEGLPQVVLQTFKCAKKDDGIPKASLMEVDEKLVNALLPFQKEGVYFGIHLKGRLLLADDMGLGKTLQALCMAAYYRNEWPLLIISPSSVRYDWAKQTCQWLPSVNPQDVNVIDSGKANITRSSVTIISYDLLSKKVFDIEGQYFKVVIMDESHFLKNIRAVRTKAALNIVKSAKRVILLSGTPALSRPSELYPQISCVCPSMFKFHDFGLRYCNAKQQPWGWDYSGSSNMAELQLLLEKKIMIRRQKTDVLSQLPAKTRQVVVLSPNLVTSHENLDKTCKIMNGARLKGMERRGVLLQYFHETCKAKLSAVRNYILDLVVAEKKFLVFAHHQEMLDNIEEAIKEKISYIRIDGRTTSEQRSYFCRKFQKSEDVKVAILSITAANAGLNLAAASMVIFAELFWNPGILVQAEDRVHRIGQENAVSIQYLTALKTADDFIWPLVQDKLNVLSKAGLTRDNFSDADTMLIADKTQRKIFDMFSEELVESNDVQDSEPDIQPKEKNPDAFLEETPPFLRTPSKKKRKPSGNISDNSPSPGTPSKKQMSITNFFPSTPTKLSKLHSVIGTTCKTATESSSNFSQWTRDDSTSTHSCDVGVSSDGRNENHVLFSQEDIQILSDVDWDEEF